MFKIKKQNLHHAYMASLQKDKKEEVFCFLEDCGFVVKNSPDFLLKETQTFLIEDAREISAFQSQMPSVGDKKLVVIFTEYFSHDSQHALLKILEEPKSGVHFFVFVSDLSTILGTLKSRFIILEKEEFSPGGASAPSENTEYQKIAKKFLSAEKDERYKMMQSFVQNFDEEKEDFLLKTKAVNFLNALEEEMVVSQDRSKYDLNLLWKVKDYIHDQGASVKNLLETLALTF